eukprot:3229210-Karenia_brevis.AAC.1
MTGSIIEDLQPAYAFITVKNIEGHGTTKKRHAFLYPHEVLASAYEHLTQEQFEKCIVGEGGESALENYWEYHKNESWVKEHPGFDPNNEHKIPACKAVPIYVHCDA